MSEPPKPVLKLKLPKPPPMDKSAQPPPETPSTSTKIKFKVKPPSNPSSQPSASAPDTVPPPPPKPKPKASKKSPKDKPVRASKPTSKKRALEASNLSDGDDDDAENAIQPPKKKTTIKLFSSKTPSITTTGVPLSAGTPAPHSAGPSRIKLIGSTKGPKLSTQKQRGSGYDSCASDAESDPAIEEDFILRMKPGDDCEYLRQAISEQRFGSVKDGGADVGMHFLDKDGRRAVVKIRGNLYAATMVDLPCIIEGMKSWDKKGWYKSVDICQMLLVLGPIKSEVEALDYPLPTRDVDSKTWQYAHGLTPPMHRVRKRRFRKRISRSKIEAVESIVEELLRKDQEADEEAEKNGWPTSTHQVLDPNRLTKERSVLSAPESTVVNGDEDAEGEEDDTQQYYEDAGAEAPDDDDFAQEFELAMMEEADAENEIASAPTEAATSTSMQPDSGTFAPSPASAIVATPAETTTSKGATSGDEESSDEDAESETAAEVDEDLLEQQQDLLRQREEIADLENAIQTQQAELERQQNHIFKRKLMAKIQSLKAELDLRKGAAGESEDTGDE